MRYWLIQNFTLALPFSYENYKLLKIVLYNQQWSKSKETTSENNKMKMAPTPKKWQESNAWKLNGSKEWRSSNKWRDRSKGSWQQHRAQLNRWESSIGKHTKKKDKRNLKEEKTIVISWMCKNKWIEICKSWGWWSRLKGARRLSTPSDRYYDF